MRVPLAVVTLGAALAACSPFVAVPLPDVAPTARDPAHEQGRQALLARLSEAQRSGRMFSGQHVGTADSPTGSWLRDPSLLTVGTHEVSVMGIEFSYGDYSTIRDDAVQSVIDFARRGGIVTIASAPANPAAGEGPWERSFTDLAALLDSSTPAGKNWAVMKANLAIKLQPIKDAHVVVLFRPFPEMNGDWFWWGKPSDPQTFKDLWIDLHHYLVQERQMDNLVWTYAPIHREWDTQAPTDAFYPGGDYVDVVGLSYYTNSADDELDKHGGWTALAALGKPMALTEHGPKPRSDVAGNGSVDYRRLLALRRAHAFSYFLVWSSWSGNKMALRDTPHGEALLDDPTVLNLE